MPVASHEALPPLDIVSPRGARHKMLSDWYSRGLDFQDIVITEGMATDVGLLGFENLGYLRIPEEQIEACTKKLVELGLDSNRWFCTVHARESGFLGAAGNTLRNADLNAYFATVVHIIDHLGGQVVRLGHPEMTKFPQIEGLIQLGFERDSTLLQAFAVSRSRFLLASPSGPLALGEAFHVPVAYANAWECHTPNDRAVFAL